MRIHFVGIGGIGVSALAQYYLAFGHQISGSDLESSEITQALKKKGAKIIIGKKEKSENFIKKADLLIYSPAVPNNHPELKLAKNLKIKSQSYPQALGDLTKKYFTIAISGTHGKSTTTAMVSLILIKAGLDPTVIVGTKLKEFGNSNCRVGKSKYLVIEADEWQASFLNYWPKIIILTNIEREHLDYYPNLKAAIKTYREYLCHLPQGGTLILNQNLDNTIFPIGKKVLPGKFKVLPLKVKVLYFGENQKKEIKKLKKILKLPGEHNLLNALAALTLSRALGIKDQISYQALSKYQGAWRRFEIIKRKPYPLISDYAHHPTEIKATILAAKEKWPKRKIFAIFQPHQYQRTYFLFDDFVKAFDQADLIGICDIYDVAGREKTKISKKVDSKRLAEKIKERKKETYYLGSFKNIPQFLKKKVKKNEVVLLMGAGNIYKVGIRK